MYIVFLPGYFVKTACVQKHSFQAFQELFLPKYTFKICQKYLLQSLVDTITRLPTRYHVSLLFVFSQKYVSLAILFFFRFLRFSESVS